MMTELSPSTREEPDDWKRKSDAFLQSLNVGHQGQQGGDPRAARAQVDRSKMQMMPNSGASQPQPPQIGMPGGYSNFAYPPPQMNQYSAHGGYTAPHSTVPQYVPPSTTMPQPGYTGSHSHSAERRRPEQERDREERRDWSGGREGRDEKKRNDSRKGSEDSSEDEREKKQKSNAPLSVEQRDKLMKQKEQYEKAAEKLEDQLLKLKEQREALKQQGQKHEDNIMKENAKLQKEVKYRIQYMKDYMEKIDKGLEEDLKKQAEANRHAREIEPERPPTRDYDRESDRRNDRGGSRERNDRGGSRERDGKIVESRNRERSLSRERESPVRESKTRDIKREESKEARREKTVRSREDSLSGSEKKSKKKKKKKAKERSSSSSESDQEHVKKKKKKRKAKSRERSSEEESGSESDGGKKGKSKKDKKGVIHMDEDVFRMVADLKGSKKRTGGHSEDMLMDLLGKMSEAYMKTKQENTELSSHCKILENQNADLKKKLEDSKLEEPKSREDPRMRTREDQPRVKEERMFTEETRVVRALEEIREVKIKQEKVAKEIVPLPGKVSKNANLEPLGSRKT